MLRPASPRRAALLGLALLAACSSDPAPDGAAERPPPTSTTRPPTTATTAASTTTAPPEPVDVFGLRPPSAATTPGALAEQIERAETTIRGEPRSEAALAEAALAQQVAYRQLGAHPEWDEAVGAALPPDLRTTAARHAQARREFRGMHTKLLDTLPAWRIVEPAPPDELLAAYHDAEAAFGIPWRYLAAINLVETGLGRIRGTSTAGAQGPMQFLPSTWEAYGAGGDIHDTHDAIMGAARYLAANGGAADIGPALFRYNNSDRYVRGVQLYADLIAEHPRAFLGFYHWGVWYLTTEGEVYLPVGYEETEPVPVGEYRSRHQR